MVAATLSMLSTGMCFVAQHARELSHPLLHLLLLVSRALLAINDLGEKTWEMERGALNGRTLLQTSGPQSEHREAAGSKNSGTKILPEAPKNRKLNCLMPSYCLYSLEFTAQVFTHWLLGLVA